jgi:glutathione S-transferase
MIKIWGRILSNVQKAMWAVGELGLEHQRIDVSGAFGKTKEAAYLAMNPNCWCRRWKKTATLWGSIPSCAIWPASLRQGRRSSRRTPCSAAFQPVDGLAIVGGGASHPRILDRSARRRKSATWPRSKPRRKTTAAMKILDAQLGKTPFVAGAFSATFRSA